VNHPQVAAFAREAKQNAIPTRKIEGQLSRLGRTVHDMMFDAIHDELVVPSPFAQAVLTFRGGADGEEPPVRIIQGPKTQIVAERGLDKVTIDPVNNEIYVATSLERVLVFDREANGDVPPKRVLGGPQTRIDGYGRPPMRVDAKNDLLLIANGTNEILIFDRLASGDVPPKAVIPGPSGIWQFEVFNDMIVYPRGNNIVAWSVHNTGDGARPLLSVPVDLGARAAQLGIALNPKYQEVIIATGQGNELRTFHVPELFATNGGTNTARANTASATGSR
jgi:hypothetical protein